MNCLMPWIDATDDTNVLEASGRTGKGTNKKIVTGIRAAQGSMNNQQS